MNREEATALLNCAQAGDDFPCRLITEALVATGDLEDGDAPIQIWRPVGSWEQRMNTFTNEMEPA